MNIVEGSTLRSPIGRGYHLRHGIDAPNAALRSDQFGNTQRRFARSGCYVEDILATLNVCVFDKSCSNRSEHLSDRFPVLLPIRCGLAPLVDDFLHNQQYIAARPAAARRAAIMASLQHALFGHWTSCTDGHLGTFGPSEPSGTSNGSVLPVCKSPPIVP